MIQYKGRVGIISAEDGRGRLDLFLLPCSEHPDPELVTKVNPELVTLCEQPKRWIELNLAGGALQGRIVQKEESEEEGIDSFNPPQSQSDPIDMNFGYEMPEEEKPEE